MIIPIYTRQGVGLVLGGGTRGWAHIGAIKAIQTAKPYLILLWY